MPSRHRDSHRLALSAARSVEKAASSALILGRSTLLNRAQQRSASIERRSMDLPQLSRHVTVGRNSQFHNLSEADREILGGIEYRSLKLLFKIIIGNELSILLHASNIPDRTEQVISSVCISLERFVSSLGSIMPLPSTRIGSQRMAKIKRGGKSWEFHTVLQFQGD